ncbi:diguanylate cyclase [Vibrio caribbeanicus]|uniref:Diguanylate cyclase n=1 Tax=Vibrio caribbeanicus TaxID=701175 RepID=A0ACC4NVA6_9VIBR|nr:diguanylate cyclase [Vibrio caribbeanicus]KHD24425.1 diguanylate cyclase [Vibrio caribbeanicus]
MDQLLVWLWETSQGHGVDFIVIIVSISILWSVYTRFQRQLEQLILQTPTAAILIDAENAQLVMANSLAKQLLGIRKIGKSYFLPQNETQQELRSLIDGLGSDSNNQAYMIEWSISQHTKVKLDVCGKQTTFRGRSVWFVSLITHQSISHEKLEELQSLRMYKSAFDHLSELVFIKNIDGELVAANRAFERFWQGRVEEGAADIHGIIEGRASKRRWTTTPDGRSCLLETNQTVLLSPEGDKVGSLGISHDVTDWHNMQRNLRDEMEKRKDTEIALAQRDTILQNILESSPDSIGIFNENMVYQACNKPFVKALGISDVDDLLGKRLQDVIPDESYSRLSETDNKVLYEGKSLRYIDRVVSSNGEYTWYDVVKSPFRDPASGTNGVLIMARDVSERYLAEQRLEEANLELERLSFIDGLTQISNRRRFDEQLKTLWSIHIREKQPLTVMLCDIDYFKGFNDYYGHLRGDEVLIKVAEVFERALPRSSDCVARYGGEEFGFILPNTTVEGAIKVAERIHQGVIELAIEHKASQVSSVVTASIGLVSIVPQPHDRSDTIVALADSALYQAKANGRNQTCVHHTSNN